MGLYGTFAPKCCSDSLWLSHCCLPPDAAHARPPSWKSYQPTSLCPFSFLMCACSAFLTAKPLSPWNPAPVNASFLNSNCSFTVCFPLVISYSSHNIQKMSYVRYLNPANQSSSNDWLDLQKYARKPPPSPGAFFKKK